MNQEGTLEMDICSTVVEYLYGSFSSRLTFS